MNYLKVGSNFSWEFFDLLREQDRNNNRIDEVYGSRSESAALVARPLFRLPDISRNDFEKYILELKKFNIAFNYTLNANFIGDKKTILQREEKILEYIRYLSSVGVDIITVSLPLMAEFIRSIDSRIAIEVSTIAHLDTITQVKIWKEKYNISKLCGNLFKNREIMFLKNLATYCNNSNITITLVANEFCGNGISENCIYRGSAATHCIFRDHCYSLHSAGYEADVKLPQDYPMGNCIQSRMDGVIWLKMNFIRPEDMSLYNSIGIKNFKITGRTGSIQYLKKVIGAYQSGQYNGNLLDLWKHLETIGSPNDYEFMPPFFIDNKKLDGFLDYWFNNRFHICAYEVCGETCLYCDNFYKSKVI